MSQRTCSLKGCDRPHLARGWCNAHYSRWLRFGDPKGSRPRPTLAARVGKNIAWSDVTGCWLWQGMKNRQGYGRVSRGGVLQLAHRVVYELLVGPIPDGLTLDHLCRVTACVNPAHLEPVTQAVNNQRSDSISAVHARKRECIHGHPFTEGNTRVDPKSGARICRACHRRSERERRQRDRK